MKASRTFLSLLLIICLHKNAKCDDHNIKQFVRTHFGDHFVIITSLPAPEINPHLTFLFSWNESSVTIFKTPTSHIVKAQNFVVIQNNLTDLDNSMSELYEINDFNTRGHFLVILQQPSDNSTLQTAFRVIFQRYRIYDVVILSNRTQFLTWYPYKKINKCGRGNSIESAGASPYGNKIPMKLDEPCDFSVTWNAYSTLVQNPRSESDPLIVYINTIAQKIGCNFVYLDNNVEFQANYIRYGNDDLLLRDIKERNIDIVIMSTGYFAKIGTLENGNILAHFGNYFVLPPRGLSPGLFKVTGDATLFLVFVIFCVTIAWSVVNKKSYGASVMVIIQIMFVGPVQQVPAKVSGKILMMAFFVYIINVNIASLATYTSNLSTPNRGPKITTMDDLANSDIPVKFSNNNIRYFKARGEQIYRKLAQRNLGLPNNCSSLESIKSFVANPNHAVFLSRETFVYFKHLENVEVLSGEQLVTTMFLLRTRKGFPFKAIVDKWIMSIKQTGLPLGKWLVDSSYRAEKFDVKDEGGRSEKEPIRLKQVFMAFELLVCGWAVGFAGFVMEVLIGFLIDKTGCKGRNNIFKTT